jgi:hypothetical protein
MLKHLLIWAFCCVSFAAAAQSITFKGKVFENNTRVGLSNVWIENLNNKQNTLSDKTGKFSIAAKLGDLVLFKGFAYQTDTVLVTSLSGTEVFLDAQKIQLKQVNISTTETAKEAPKYDRLYHNQAVVYHRDYKGNYDGGITIRLRYWKAGDREKARLEKKLKEFDTMDQIHQLFIPDFIGKYVPLTGEELDNFISLYTPGVKEFSRRDFNLVVYLSDSYKSYLALPADKRKPQPITN